MNTDSQTLNCIIPDEWVRKCVAQRLLEPNDRAPFGKGQMKVSNSKNRDGFFSQKSLQRETYSLLKRHQLIWIRTPKTKEVAAIASQLDVRFLLIVAKTISAGSNYRHRTVWKKNCGIAVDIRDACRVLVTFKPKLIEERRAEVYNNDEH